MTLNELRDEAHRIAREKGWWEEERTFGDMVALGHSEWSEALEEYRNHHEPTEVYYGPVPFPFPFGKPNKPLGIPIELADVLIRVFDMAGFYGIDLDEAVRLKTEYNKTRPYRHGGKVM